MTTDARDARGLTEDGFHEIQLSGKQLVFLFMATTVVSVVIFLCGVLVGRGVRTELGSEPVAAAGPQAATAQPPAGDGAVDPGKPTEVPATEWSFPKQLSGKGDPDAAAETLNPADEPVDVDPPPATQRAAQTPPPAAPPAQAQASPAPAPPPAAAAPAASAPASRDGFTVQVAALRERREAEVIAKRLTGRGYDAYVVEPAAGGAPMYRVRVGSFKDRREADKIVKRLQQEEQFKPWITR